jgi:hypothetical protein
MSEKDKDDYNSRFKPNEIPATVTFDMVIWYSVAGWEVGQIGAYSFPFKGDDERVVLGTQRVTFEIPPQDQNGIKSKVLDMLEEKKREVLAENHRRLKEVQDKIDQLLAIEYQPESGAA